MEIKKLKKGDKVAIVSLSSGILGEPFIKHELDLGIKRIEEMGLVPVFMENTLKGIDFVKNNPAKRFDDLKNAFKNPEIKAIISAIGGDDSYKLLPYILSDPEFKELVKNNPKIFMGYSDTTTIHLALAKLGLNTFYGPAFVTDFAEFENEMLPYTKNGLMYLFDAPKTYQIKPSDVWYDERTDFSPAAVGTNRVKHNETNGLEFLKGFGVKSGKLIGGCIEVIYGLTSHILVNGEKIVSEKAEITENFPIVPTKTELNDKVLFLETSDGKPSKEDYQKMISRLKDIGLFNNISALLIGKPMDEAHYEEYKEVLLEELENFNFPIVYNFNFGHSFPRMTLPIGATVEVDTENKTVKLLDCTLV